MKMNVRILSLSVLGAMYSMNAVAADNTPSTTFQTINIVAYNTQNANQTGEVLHDEKIPAKQADSLHDYLSSVPGVNVRGSSAFDQHISIRGIGNDNNGSLLKTTVDGVRQPETTGFHHAGTYGLDTDLYKATEVSVGNNSVTLGNNAMGGAVAFRTVDAEDLLRPDQKIGARVKVGYASNDEQLHTTVTAYGKPTENSDVLLSYGRRESDGGEDGNGDHIIGEDITIENILAKLSFKPADGHKISLSYQDYNNEGNYPFRPNNGYKSNLPNDIKPGFIKTKTYSLGYDYNPNDNFNLTSKLYKLENESKTNGTPGVGGLGETTGLNLNVNQRINQGKLTHGLTYGVEAYEKMESSLTGTSEDKTLSTGVYIQDRIGFGRLVLTPGVRYDNYKVTPAAASSKTYDKVSGALGAEVKVLDNTTVFASYTQLFNGPRLPETIRSQWIYDPANLKPETGSNTEVGFNTNFNNVLADNDRLGLTAKYFNTDYKNRFSTANIGGKTAFTNAGDVEYKGYEAMVNYRLNDISLNLGYAHAKSEDAKGYQLSQDSGDQYTFGFDYGNPDHYLIGVDFRHVAGLMRKGEPGGRNPTGITDLKSFTTVDLTGSYKPQRLKNVTIDAGIYNLTDEVYTEHTSNNVKDYAMGRNAKIALTYQF